MAALSPRFAPTVDPQFRAVATRYDKLKDRSPQSAGAPSLAPVLDRLDLGGPARIGTVALQQSSRLDPDLESLAQPGTPVEENRLDLPVTVPVRGLCAARPGHSANMFLLIAAQKGH